MAKCYILCNINNKKTRYIVSNYAGSNISYFLGSSIPKSYDVVFINVGAPIKKWRSKEYFNETENLDFKIVEFSHGPSLLPTRFKSKTMIKHAIKFLLNKRKNGDKLIIYHSISFMKYYKKLIDAFREDNTIIHVAELYSEVGNTLFPVKKEIDGLQCFNKYIFMSTGLMKKIIGDVKNKLYIFLYGVYNSSSLTTPKKSKVFHVVYAGTSSRIKGGLFTALKASQHLPPDFVMHIFCRADNSLIKEIESYNVIYEGYVDEQYLNKTISTFDIGLATQNPFLPFNDSSFPSKIVNYLSCGLNVVSSKSQSVKDSPFDKKVFYYDEDMDGTNCSKAIIDSSKKLDKEKNKEIIEAFDKDFKKQLSFLFEENT